MNKIKEEVWKEVPNYEDYMVSDRGGVKSMKYGRERLMRLSSNQYGYLLLNLSKEGKRKVFRVHKLVAMAFLNHVPCGHKLVVDHIDGNRTNNHLSNLQVITNRENTSKDRRGGSSRYVGVSWNKQHKKWEVHIHVNGKRKYLGVFTNEIEASEAYQNKLKEIQINLQKVCLLSK